MVDIWKKLLNVDLLGVNDNIFDIGGNSLSMILANNQLRERLKKDIDVIKMFEYPTIRSFTRHLYWQLDGEGHEENSLEQLPKLDRVKQKMKNTAKQLRRTRNGQSL
jgi:hypothetical protein